MQRRATGTTAHLIVLLGGEAGLRCGEIMALEWRDVDLANRQLCVARSEWKGHVTAPKGGRIRHVPLTEHLAEALKASETSPRTAGNLRREGTIAHAEGRSGDRSTSREEGSGEARSSHPAPHLLLASCDEGSAGESDSGARWASRPDHDAAVHAPHTRLRSRRRLGCWTVRLKPDTTARSIRTRR